ncbi:MAG: hypothetical protein AB1465_00030 [Patescibacteria group bacterium]
MISNFRKFTHAPVRRRRTVRGVAFVKFISAFISFVFLFTQLELKVFANPIAPNPIFGGLTSKYPTYAIGFRSLQTIQFRYDDLNRLIDKGTLLRQGFEGQANNVYTSIATYTYDDAQKPNCIGRLSRVEYTSGSTEFFYDTLGREIQTVKKGNRCRFWITPLFSIGYK